jgi:hypothetical protein
VTIRFDGGTTVWLEGDCSVEDAEMLLSHLIAWPEVTIDWRGCERAHSAIVQVLLAAGAHVRGPPAGIFLREHVQFLLQGGDESFREVPGCRKED